VSDAWRTDELFLKVKGNMRYLHAMMDDETRYWIAQEVAETKYTHDVRKLFQKSKDVAGKIPRTLISDGANNFHDAYRKEFLSPFGETPSATHVRDVRFDGLVQNNKMERMNGEVRDREKTMRGLKTVDTQILKGVLIFHNYIKPHEGLGGKTPAEAAGITVEGDNTHVRRQAGPSLPPACLLEIRSPLSA
jgi:putative transposase